MHWRNSRFQVAYFLAGKCHTADEAYRLLCELREDRDIAIKMADAGVKRQEAKIVRAKKALSSDDEAERLEAEADLLEVEANRNQAIACYAEALREVQFLDKAIEMIQPLRKFAHLPDHEAHQMAQWDEWKLELINRSQNYLLTTGTIPPDHYQTMRLHPAFQSEIAPEIMAIKAALHEGRVSLMAPPDSTNTFMQAVQQLVPAEQDSAGMLADA